MLKKILLALVLVVATTVTHADPIGISEGGGTPDPGVQYGITDPEEDEVVEEEDNGMKIAASKAYVDTMVETRQDKIPAANQQGVGAGETVMTYTAAGNGAIGERGLYSDISSYDATTDGDKLITASALNATFTNLPTTPTTKLECANQADGCTLWTIVDQTAYAIQLPDGYTRLEYIQSDGASYLIIPYRVNNKTVFYCRYNEIQKGPQIASVIFGVTSAPTVSQANYGIVRLLDGASNFNRMGWGDSTPGSVIDVNAPRNLDTWYEVLYDQNKLYQDNVLYATSATPNDTEWAANYDLGIFARNGTSVTMNAVVKISNVWAKEDGEYKLNLIPARRDSDNVLGMYDTVSGQFFTNSGTGNFAGPAAN